MTALLTVIFCSGGTLNKRWSLHQKGRWLYLFGAGFMQKGASLMQKGSLLHLFAPNFQLQGGSTAPMTGVHRSSCRQNVRMINCK